MPKSLKSMSLRVAAISIAATFVSIGPYLHYDREYRSAIDPSVIHGPITHPDLSHLPYIGDIPDFASIKDIKAKKTAFFDFLRPKIALENRRIQKERAFLESLRIGNVTKEQISYAERLAALYSYPLRDSGMSQQWLDEMLKRVNVLPEALVLTQAANESAWGTSRFATQANNLFGQWCYKTGCGIIPAKRGAGQKHEVKKFESVQESVHGYFMNVNRNRAYADLRDIRANLAKNNKDLLSVSTATELTHGLLAYSERGIAYVNDLRAMIRHNNAYWTQ
ncbi:glucosaminidase domain-containing protein [Vibrio alfacsensis]|uniref:glucosaminidase domain-containing protein n=1 Tax=Vibrio alfacsensis TaxID=1074311 RepID=UPI001C7F334C|nr:glucosaminidase domain-containing protein [Vibrio alfacsensis]